MATAPQIVLGKLKARQGDVERVKLRFAMLVNRLEKARGIAPQEADVFMERIMALATVDEVVAMVRQAFVE